MRVNLTELKALSSDFNAYFDALSNCFVGRENIIRLLKLAMAQRQHILIFGPPGTAKTALCDVALAGITGAEKFMVELSAYLTEDAFFGPFDAKKMREEGVMEHRTEGMLPRADFARIGEFLDGNMASLRALLSSLNERRLRRGRQIIDMPLLTVYCDTNQDPGVFLQKNGNAWAILDRILYMSYLGYLDTSEEVTEMIKRFQSGATTKAGRTISLDLIHRLSEVIVYPPSLITDQVMLMKLGQAFTEYREQRKDMIKDGKVKVVLPDISDRRICLASDLVEVSAVLDGRIVTVPEDMRLVQYAVGTTPEELELWREIIDRKIEEIAEEKKQRLEAAQSVALEAIDQQIQKIDLDNDTKEVANTLRVLATQLDNIAPDNDGIDERKQALLEKLAEMRSDLQHKVLKEYNLNGNHNNS